jgi:DNA-binding CsgD family transcriptional regulator
MPDNDLFLQTIEAVYASGLDSDRLPEALESTSRLLGGIGATYEVISKQGHQPVEFWSAGLPAVSGTQYIEHFAALNPRIPLTLHQCAGDVAWDHQLFDESGMDQDPFYSDFLPQLGLRYFVSVVLEQTPDKLAVISVQRSKKQGHVDKREVALMRQLCPHMQRAHDLATRLKARGNYRGLLESALDWLTHGVALLRADGTIVYVNETLRSLAQRGDGFRIVSRAIEFAEPNARRRFGEALGAIERLGDPAFDARPTDFPVARSDENPAYIVSLRPIVRGQTPTRYAGAKVMLLISDPLRRNIAGSQMLQDMFNLTNAEAHLARALCTGQTTSAYANERRVSINTVYSHLKKIREKTGCKSIPELIRKFREWNVPLRVS